VSIDGTWLLNKGGTAMKNLLAWLHLMPLLIVPGQTVIVMA
jgi:hypothetical protein